MGDVLRRGRNVAPKSLHLASVFRPDADFSAGSAEKSTSDQDRWSALQSFPRIARQSLHVAIFNARDVDFSARNSCAQNTGYALSASSSDFSICRSFRLARRMARAMNGASQRAKPLGSPRLRRVMRVALPTVSQV